MEEHNNILSKLLLLEKDKDYNRVKEELIAYINESPTKKLKSDDLIQNNQISSINYQNENYNTNMSRNTNNNSNLLNYLTSTDTRKITSNKKDSELISFRNQNQTINPEPKFTRKGINIKRKVASSERYIDKGENRQNLETQSNTDTKRLGSYRVMESQKEEFKTNTVSIDDEAHKLKLLRNLVNESESEKVIKFEILVEDLQLKLKMKEEEKVQLKEMYEKELKIKSEIYNLNVTHLTKTHQEEIKNLRMQFEIKMDEIVKRTEEEKYEMTNQLNNYQNQIEIMNKNSLENIEKDELLKESQKQLIELQNNFDNFKVQSKKQLNSMKMQKIENSQKYKELQESYNKIKGDLNASELRNKESELKIKNYTEKYNNLLKNNESLTSQIEQYKGEMIKLKNDLVKFEESEKDLKKMIIDMNRGIRQNETNGFDSNRKERENKLSISQSRNSYEKTDFNALSLIAMTQSPSKFNKLQEQYLSIKNSYRINENRDTIEFEENNVISSGIKSANEKIKEMENCLNRLSSENRKSSHKSKEIYFVSPDKNQKPKRNELTKSSSIYTKKVLEKRSIRNSSENQDQLHSDERNLTPKMKLVKKTDSLSPFQLNDLNENYIELIDSQRSNGSQKNIGEILVSKEKKRFNQMMY